jgi:hypothetical protein
MLQAGSFGCVHRASDTVARSPEGWPTWSPGVRPPADAYFKAVQDERVIRGEPSDRLNVIQQEMIETGDRYEILKELLKDPEFRKFSNRVLGLQGQVRMRREGGG